MSSNVTDHSVLNDNWSDLSRVRPLPEIDFGRLHAYRIGRVRKCLADAGASMCLLVSPISLRYTLDFRQFALFQSHVPSSYVFLSAEGPTIVHNVYGTLPLADEHRAGRALSFFDGAEFLPDSAALLADDVVKYLSDIGTDNRRVAVEYVNPSITQALEARGLEVIDGVAVMALAKAVKSADEIACMRWSIAVAEHGIEMMKTATKPGVTELALWALLNYTNIANDGDWHEGRMLASGPRTNPWFQNASNRRIESGDLIAVDTDMIGPFGYCCDISRTWLCGPATPSGRQKELYQLAVEEIEHNLKLVRAGITFNDLRARSFVPPDEFNDNAYPCIIHGVGMSDEYPRIDPASAGPAKYDGVLEAGMVISAESFMGTGDEPNGVKLEQQVLVTDDGYELLSTHPYEESLMT